MGEIAKIVSWVIANKQLFVNAAGEFTEFYVSVTEIWEKWSDDSGRVPVMSSEQYKADLLALVDANPAILSMSNGGKATTERTPMAMPSPGGIVTAITTLLQFWRLIKPILDEIRDESRSEATQATESPAATE